MYIIVSTYSGTPGQMIGEDDANVIEELRYVSQPAIQTLNVFPSELKNTMWDDYRAGFIQTRYLGIFTRD